MGKIFALTAVLLVLGFTGCVQEGGGNDVPIWGLTEQECSDASGHWNECGSRCMLDNQGREGVACPAICEQLCECAGIAGFGCPEGYECKFPEGVADALGYCVPAQEEEDKTGCVGCDRDEHGCIASAGYSWCEEKQECVRPWEVNCSDYTIVETTNVSCEEDAECETPFEYLVMSHCPYTSKCLDKKCTVICPFPFKPSVRNIRSFEECVEAGYPVMESYPRQCRTPWGGTFTEEAGLANPAAVYCEKKGGRVEIVETPGGQAGYCILEDGRSCEEWAFYRSGGEECKPPEEDEEPFCGWSTNGSCTTDEDCAAGGCSGQVCESKNEDSTITTCEFRECYRASDYGLGCRCVENICRWSA